MERGSGARARPGARREGADPAYRHADGYRGRAGISWLHRWAMAEKKPKVFYEGEPAVPQHVLDIAGVEGE